jgi:D-xylose transport system permease protein
MDEPKKPIVGTATLRAYIMLAVLAVIWIVFHYSTSPDTPLFWEKVWHPDGFNGIVSAIGEQLGFFFDFTWLGNGIFLQARNLSNLMTQMSVTAIIAVGMLMVIVSGNIDLSAGSVLGFTGGVVAYLMTAKELVMMTAVRSILTFTGGLVGYLMMPQDADMVTAILVAILVGLLIGLLHGTLVAYGKIPAFIVTLGGLLAWRGAVKWLLGGNTVPIANDNFIAIGNGDLPASFGRALAAVAVLFVCFMAYRKAKSVETYGLGRANYTGESLKAVVPIAGIIAFITIMNAWRGIPFPVLILAGVALIGAFITNSTVFGRYLYAIGGNADAARLSGINNKRQVLKVYGLLGAFIGIAALIFTARVGSAAPDAGVLKELDAIAACVIGGASLMGGRGTVFGACLGALIMASLDNGMSLLNVRDFMQDIIKGGILVAAVGLDVAGRRQG